MEIITGIERRRRWRVADKLRILAELDEPGVKFNDAELIGVPTIVVVGRGLADGVFEVKDRRSGERRDVAIGEVVMELRARSSARSANM